MDHISSTFLTDLIRSTIALFVVIDPVGSVPVFIALTQKMERTERASVAKTAIITAAGLLFVFAVAGTQILSIFSITISSFMVAVASCFSLYRLSFLHTASGDLPAQGRRVNQVLSHWHFRLLAGPGAITAVIISFQTTGLIVTALSILIVIGITYVVLSTSIGFIE